MTRKIIAIFAALLLSLTFVACSEQETTEDAVVAALLAEYDVDEAAARTHVAAFVAKLKEQDFLV